MLSATSGGQGRPAVQRMPDISTISDRISVKYYIDENSLSLSLSLSLSSLLSAFQVLGKCETLKIIPWNPRSGRKVRTGDAAVSVRIPTVD